MADSVVLANRLPKWVQLLNGPDLVSAGLDATKLPPRDGRPYIGMPRSGPVAAAQTVAPSGIVAPTDNTLAGRIAASTGPFKTNTPIVPPAPVAQNQITGSPPAVPASITPEIPSIDNPSSSSNLVGPFRARQGSTTINQPTGTINGKPVGIAPVPVSLSELPQQVQKDYAGVAGNAPENATVVTSASPGEQRTMMAPYIDPKTGQMVAGVGSPSSVVAYPQGTGPTRPKPLTEGQIQDNRNIASKIFASDANLQPTQLERETKARWNAPGYKGPGFMMQSPTVRRQIEAEAQRVQGDQRATTDFDRASIMRSDAASDAIALQEAKNKGVIGSAQAAKDAAIDNQNARFAEQKELRQMGIDEQNKRDENKAKQGEVSRDYKVINDEWKTWTKPGVADMDALPHLISLAQEAHASGLHNSPAMLKQMADTSARIASSIAKANGFDGDKARVDLLQRAILKAGGDVNHPDVVKIAGSK